MGTIDTDLLARLRAALKDPIERGIIEREIQDAAGSSVSGALSNIGTSMANAKTPAGSAAVGLGGALGMGLGMMLKKRRQNQSALDPMANRTGDNPVTASGGIEPNLTGVAGGSSTTSGGAIEVPAAEAWNHGAGTADIGPKAAPATPSPPVVKDATAAPISGISRFMTGTDLRGNAVTSYDGGQTWKTDNGQPYSGDVYNQFDPSGIEAPRTTSSGALFRRGGQVRGFAQGGTTEVVTPPPPAKKGVLVRRPMPMPILHTTIVITPVKSKKEQPPKGKPKGRPPKTTPRKRFGNRETPRKPKAIPPEKGPGNAAPAPFKKGGHVQVPRGSGCAVKGKRFGGIY